MSDPTRGTCPVCANPRILAPGGRLSYHGALVGGLPYGRCPGTAQKPVVDLDRLAALEEFNRHKPGIGERCRECSTYGTPRRSGAPPTADRIVKWPCPAREAAWAAFAAQPVPQ